MVRKNKKSPQHQPLSPKKYILTRARLLPIYKCFVNKNWRESKLAAISVTRKHSNSHITAGIYLVDMMAKGVKDTHYMFNKREEDALETIYSQFGEDFMEEIPYTLAHNIIYGGVAFAEEHHFRQHPDFEITEHILEEDTDGIEFMDLEFGVNGKPFIMEAFYEEDELEDDDGDDEEPPDFEEWNDNQWRDFFNSKEEFPTMHVSKAVWVLFDRWFNENYPFSLRDHPAVNALKKIKITYDEIDPLYFENQEIPEEAEKIARELMNADNRQEYKRINARLQELVTANPENPVYLQYLAICMGADNDPDFRKIIETMLEKFPDFPYSRMTMANVLMDAGNMEEAEKLFDNRFTLPDLYPGRKTFNINELIGFSSTMMRLFLHKGDIEAVNVNCKIMNAMDNEGLMYETDLFVKVFEKFVKKKMEIVADYIIDKGYVKKDGTNLFPVN